MILKFCCFCTKKNEAFLRCICRYIYTIYRPVSEKFRRALFIDRKWLMCVSIKCGCRYDLVSRIRIKVEIQLLDKVSQKDTAFPCLLNNPAHLSFLPDLGTMPPAAAQEADEIILTTFKQIEWYAWHVCACEFR